MSIWTTRWQKNPLPIDEKLDELLTLLKNHQVVICEAETGAGKTTRIGQAAILADTDLHVFLTQPRRNACRWNAARIASEMGCRLGGVVGWRLFGQKSLVGPETRLQLMIDQSLVNQIERENNLPAGLIIVDEAHERSIAIDLLLGLIKEKLPSSHQTKVLITSATIDTEKFSQFFHGAPTLHLKGRCFPVNLEPLRLRRDEHHTQGATRAALEVLNRFLQGTLSLPEGCDRGTVLILLPGKEDISSVMAAIQRGVEEYKVSHRVQVLSCYGESSPEEQDLVQSEIPEATLRFVCGTEVLRASVTVKGTVGVIDSLQVKRLNVDAHGVSQLVKEAVSAAEADQGQGRAGRTAPGFYIPISFEMEYEYLQRYPLPAILRESVTRTALQVAAIGHSIRTFSFIDEPPKDKVEVALRRLVSLGALTKEEVITEVGRQLFNLPLSPEQAKVLLTAKTLHVLSEAIVVTAILEVGNFFNRKKEGKEIPKEWSKGVLSDFSLLVQAYRNFKKVDNKKINLFAWCNDRGLKLKRIRLAEDKMAQICQEMEHPVKSLAVSHPYEEEALIKALVSGLFDNMGRRNIYRSRQFLGKIGEFKLAEESLCAADSSLILAAEVTKIPVKMRRTTHFLLATLGAALKKEWLMELLPQLCTRRRLGDLRYNEKKNTVLETEQVFFEEDLLLQEFQIETAVLPEHCTRRRLGDLRYDKKRDVVLETEEVYFKKELFIGNFTIETAVLPEHCTRRRLGVLRYDEKRDVVLETEEVYFEKYLFLGKFTIETAVLSEHCTRKRLNDSRYDLEQDSVGVTEIVYFKDKLELRRVWVTLEKAVAAPILASFLAKHSLSGEKMFLDRWNYLFGYNFEIQSTSLTLNQRAGQPLFKVYTLDEVTSWFERDLQGATSFKEVDSVEKFFFPSLDKEKVAQVLRENPSEIAVLSQPHSVDYLDVPRITVLARNWGQLLMQEMVLPGGRSVQITISEYSETLLLKWKEGHVDFSGQVVADRFISTLKPLLENFIKAQNWDKLPFFLLSQQLEDETVFLAALDKLSKWNATFIPEVAWCVVMQVIAKAKKEKSTTLLKKLESHPLVNYQNAVVQLLSGIKWFSSMLESDIRKKLRETIAEIHEAEKS